MSNGKGCSIAAVCAVFAVALCACSSQSAVKQAASGSGGRTDVVRTQYGDVRGVAKEGEAVELFAGIPYAKPPVGDLRWKEPAAPEPWEGVLEADSFAPKAMQSKSKWYEKFIYRNFIYHDPDGDRQDYFGLSEDCLYLNVWRPEGASEGDNLPVVVYIHGGSLMSGGSAGEAYDGTTFAQNGVIMVTIAYRLGVFGYFADSELAAESLNGTTGNYGLLDQIAAVRWVHDNIASFGGDPGNITIAGESAGSSSVNALCASPLAKGLFRRVIAESSGLVAKVPPHTWRSMEEALSMGGQIKAEFKADSVAALRAIPAEKLIKTKFSNNAMTIDGYALTEPPYQTYGRGANNEEAVLGGFNANEGYFFNFFGGNAKLKTYRAKIEDYFGEYADAVLELFPASTDKEAKDNWNQICGAVLFAYEHRNWSRFVSAEGHDAYLYFFTMENNGIGTNHSGEIIYAYGNVPKTKWYTDEDHALERTMVSYWLNFARTGNPNGEGLPRWESFSSGGGQVLELGQQVSMRDDPYRKLYDIIDLVMEKGGEQE